ncbi:RAMP superfamily CRISPR-associated protein [Methanomethylovorans sp.]|uniref:RAMP superfamily CRISPR-associated protein n=1 Tax=Methanomethylovorans sp. TaxID=2758717 RepID=UPI00345E519D
MWTLYQVSLRVLSPIHIGWKKTSNLQQTRFYVPAKTIWGALTARITRDKNSSDYKGTGNKINENLRFSYFYPYDSNSSLNECEFPWENPDNFTWKYIGSYQSAALENKTAMEGMLHETECILPKTRDGNQVYLLGCIIEKNECNIDWKTALPKIQIGGERGYGWGRVNMDNKPAKCKQFFGYDFDPSQEEPVIKIPKGEFILAHTLASEAYQQQIGGNIEPFVGRITENGRFGGYFSEARICWIPGSKLVNSDMNFKICENGFWSVQE